MSTSSDSMSYQDQTKAICERKNFFASREGLLKRYREAFRKELYSLNPTAWQYVDGEWERILL